MKQKKHKTIEKVEMSEMSMINPIFFTYSHKYIINLLWKSGLSISIFLSMRKTCKIKLNPIILKDFFIISKRVFEVMIV